MCPNKIYDFESSERQYATYSSAQIPTYQKYVSSYTSLTRRDGTPRHAPKKKGRHMCFSFSVFIFVRNLRVRRSYGHFKLSHVGVNGKTSSLAQFPFTARIIHAR